MSSNVGHNVYKGYLSQNLTEGGSETVVYVDRLTTLTGETMATADFSDLSYGVLVINPEGDGSTSYPEFISFTAIDSSAVSFTGCIRGLSSKATTTVTANKRFHPIGTPVTISWGIHSWKLLKDYVDTSVASFTSFFAPGTAGETVVAGNLVYFDDTDNEWKKCDADTAATVENTLLGIAQGAGVDGGAITDGVLLFGYDDNQTGMTPGALQYASNTAGGISETPGTKEVTLGYSRSATTLYFNPRFNQQLTENQQDLVQQIEAGTDWYAASVVGTDSYAITIAPPITAYTTGMKFRFKADVANTGAATLAVSGLSALAIKKNNDQDLASADIEAGQIVEVVYDGTDFQMQSQVAKTGASNTLSFTAGETVTAGQPAARGTGRPYRLTNNASAGTDQTLSTTAWVSQSFTTSARAVSIKNVAILVRESAGSGASSVTLTVSIRADSGGSPTGSDIESKTATVVASGGANLNRIAYLTFSSPVTVSPSTVYHVIVRSSGSSFALRRNNTAGQGTNASTDSGSTWGAANGKIWFDLGEIDTVEGRMYVADADLMSRLDYVGFFATDSTTGNAVSVQVDGVVAGLSGLTAGVRYYASDTGTLSSTVGTYEVPLGIAVSTTELMIEKTNDVHVGTYTGTGTDVYVGQSIIVAPCARYAVVYVSGVKSGTASPQSDSVILYRIGLTAVSITNYSDALQNSSYSITWSNDFLQITDTTTDANPTYSVYFYK